MPPQSLSKFFSGKSIEDGEWEELEQVFDEGSSAPEPSPTSDIQDVSSGGDSDSDWEPVDSPKKVTEALAADKKSEKNVRAESTKIDQRDDVKILDNVEANFGHFHAIKNNHRLIYQLKDPEGNIYYRNQIRGDIIYWRCVKNLSHQCKARAVTRGKMLEKLIGIHADHSPKVHGNTGHNQHSKKFGSTKGKGGQKKP